MCLGVGDKGGSSVVRRSLSARAVLLDVLGFPVVDLDDLLAVVALEPQNLIQLRMQSLKLAVLGSHNKEGHAEHDQLGCPVPVKALAVEDEPAHSLEEGEPKAAGCAAHSPSRVKACPIGRFCTERERDFSSAVPADG